MNAIDNIKENLSLIIIMVVFIMFFGSLSMFLYNFTAVSNEKIYDAENKYINESLPNPDVEENYKEVYKAKQRFDGVQLSLMDFFNSAKGIAVFIFVVMFLFILILYNWRSVYDNIKKLFD